MSLFGAPATTGNTQPLFGGQQSSASLFGQSGSLFGASNPSSSASGFGAPSTGTSLFGGSASSASLFGGQTSSSLFGASSSSLFGAPASSASLFGANSGSLFGNTGGFGSFGAASSSSLFGASQPTSSLFTTPGLQNQQQQQQQQQQEIEVPGRTRISQLPEKLQKDLFAIESHLREQRSRASQLTAKRTEYESKDKQVSTNTNSVTRRIVKLRAELEALQGNATALKSAVRNERSSAEPVAIALDNISRKKDDERLLIGNRTRYGGMDIRQHYNCHIPEEYFERTLHDVESRAHGYKAEIDEIAEFLKAQGIAFTMNSGPFSKADSEDGTHSAQLNILNKISKRHHEVGLVNSDYNVESQGKTIEEVIRRQYEYFMVVASHIAAVDESLRVLREQFLNILRSRNPDSMDPFRQADMKEKAEKERSRILAEQQASKRVIANSNGSNISMAPSTTSSATQGSLSQGFGSSFGSGLFGGGTNSTNDPNAGDMSSRKKRTF